MVTNNPRRRWRGRQRVAMVRMEKESNRLVTFSKRRCGLFKKTNELCTLCGVEAAIIVFSPGRKAYSFGHPEVDTVVDRFLGVSDDPSRSTFNATHQNDANVLRFNVELALLNARIEGEQEYNEKLVKMRKSKGEELKWLTSIEDLDLVHLKKLLGPITELRTKVFDFGQKLMSKAISNANSSAAMFPNPTIGLVDPFPISSFEMDPTNPLGSLDAPNVVPFEGQRGGDPPMPINMGMNPPLMLGNLGNLTSMFMGLNNPMTDPNSPSFNAQGGFGIGPKLF